MSRPPPLPPPPGLAAAALPQSWHLPSWPQEEQHTVPPPPGVPSAPPALQQQSLFPWSPDPGRTGPIITANSPGIGAAVFRQHAPVQPSLMTVNETGQIWANFDSPGGIRREHQPVAGYYSTDNGFEAGSFGYGVQTAFFGAQNFAFPPGCNAIASHFPAYIPSGQNPQQVPPGESGLPQKMNVLETSSQDKANPRDLIPNLRALISQVNDSVAKILKMMKISPDKLPVQGVDAQAVASTVPNFASISPLETGNDHRTALQNTQVSDDFATANSTFSSILTSLRKSKENPFYNDTPGIVQIPVFAIGERFEDSKLPDFAVGERWDKLSSQGREVDGQAEETLLPSQYWQISKEVSEWKDLPSKLSSYQRKAVAGLSRIQLGELRNWILSCRFSYGVTFSRCMVDQILMLAVFCLRAVHREAMDQQDSNDDMRAVNFKTLSQSASWLTAQLSSICDAGHSRNLVFDLYKYAIKMGAYYSVRFRSRRSNKAFWEEKGPKIKHRKESDTDFSEEPCSPSCRAFQAFGDQSSCVGDGILCLQQLASAILAVKEQAVDLKCKASQSVTSASDQRSVVHSMLTKKAAEIRATRLNYKMVLEHDGLMWQRPQNQESKRNMTKEEQLAEERDYKRRRMSYRGKKVQRTPVEVLRDIIEGHMEDIVASGGIGCIGRRPQDGSLEELGTISSALGTKDHTNFHDTRSTRDASIREACTSYRDESRSESTKLLRNEKEDRHRYDTGSYKSSSSSKSSKEKPERRYNLSRDPSRLDYKSYGDKHHSRKYHS